MSPLSPGGTRRARSSASALQRPDHSFALTTRAYVQLSAACVLRAGCVALFWEEVCSLAHSRGSTRSTVCEVSPAACSVCASRSYTVRGNAVTKLRQRRAQRQSAHEVVQVGACGVPERRGLHALRLSPVVQVRQCGCFALKAPLHAAPVWQPQHNLRTHSSASVQRFGAAYARGQARRRKRRRRWRACVTPGPAAGSGASAAAFVA